MRTRKLIGAIILLGLLVCWLFLGLALAPVAFGSSYRSFRSPSMSSQD